MNIEDMVEITLKNDEDFLKVKETLTRIGIPSKAKSVLSQSCHILHKRGRYFIVHFKELFALDGKETDFSNQDMARRNTIANLLEEWGLLDLVIPEKSEFPVVPVGQIKVISYKDKENWTLKPKYSIYLVSYEYTITMVR